MTAVRFFSGLVPQFNFSKIDDSVEGLRRASGGLDTIRSLQLRILIKHYPHRSFRLASTNNLGDQIAGSPD